MAREIGEDSTRAGQHRETLCAHNDALWQSWLQQRALAREKARLERAAALAARREAARRKEAAAAQARLEAARDQTTRAQALSDAPHLDCLDPMACALSWAKKQGVCAPDAPFERAVDPEAEDATAPARERSPASKPVKRRDPAPRERVRK